MEAMPGSYKCRYQLSSDTDREQRRTSFVRLHQKIFYSLGTMGRAGRDILQSGCRHCRSQNILELAKNELYYHTDNHGCPRTTRRIILSHGQSRMSTDDTGNYYMIHVSQVICLCYVLSSFCFTVQYKGFHDLVRYFFYGFSTIDGK